MLVPLAGADLVADQRVARRRIGDAQQRLGQAHQRDALLRRQRIFLQQSLHQTFAAAGVAAIAQALRRAGARAPAPLPHVAAGRRASARSGGTASVSARRYAAVIARAQRRALRATGRRGSRRVHLSAPGATATSCTSIAAARSSSALPTDLKTVRAPVARRESALAARELRERADRADRDDAARDRADQVAALLRRVVAVDENARAGEAVVVGLAHGRREGADQVEVARAAQPAAAHQRLGGEGRAADDVGLGDRGLDARRRLGLEAERRQLLCQRGGARRQRAQTVTRSIGRTTRCASGSSRAMRPAPIIARWRARGARARMPASADVAAVRRAVISSPSIQASGTPVVAS